MEEEFWYLELLKEHLSCPDAIANRIVGRFSQKHGVLSRVDLQLVEDVSPDLLHVVPVLDDAVLHRVGQLEDALEFLLHRESSDRCELVDSGTIMEKETYSLLTDEPLLLLSREHDPLVLGSTNTTI